MKQVLENFRTGACAVEEVPPPEVRPGFVVVRNHYSLISSGTEGGTVKLGRMSLLGKARARPEQTRKVFQVAKQQGVMTAVNVAMRALEMPIALGYSCAGEVIEVGEGVSGFAVGDRVACGGAGYANHAEVVSVPRNLCVMVPEGVGTRHAAFGTVGAIAMQSVRIANTRLGENVIVIGLGLLGQITTQILRAAGCNVFGIDIDPERVRFAQSQGCCDGALGSEPNLVERVQAFTRGYGADAVIITAAGLDNGPVALAGEILRRKGRTVVVGRTEMTAPRETYLFKELELLTSMAFGPGTGDPVYELGGVDYPIGYVRWTENRNMEAFLDLIAQGRLNLDPLISHEFIVDEAGKAFDLISGKTSERSTAVLLRYPIESEDKLGPTIIECSSKPVVNSAPKIRYGMIGAGSFATNEFMPLLANELCATPRLIASATGVRAKALGAKYGFVACAADAYAVINDQHTDCVFILTRHDTHARLAVAALMANKHVFVEKPLALTVEELEQVQTAQRFANRLLMVGFNRRYAPLALRLREYIGDRAQPMSILYRANIGYRPPEHWLHHPKEGGGVVLGEACHHIDFCCWMVGQPVSSVSVHLLGDVASGIIPQDNVHITLKFRDGSLATIAYLSNGSRTYNTERIEVSCDNRVATLTDFRVMEMADRQGVKRRRQWFSNDKGHADQIRAFLNAVQGHGDLFDISSYLSSSAVTIRAAALVRTSAGSSQ